jgi:hypothetical protein
MPGGAQAESQAATRPPEELPATMTGRLIRPEMNRTRSLHMLSIA